MILINTDNENGNYSVMCISKHYEHRCLVQDSSTKSIERVNRALAIRPLVGSLERSSIQDTSVGYLGWFRSRGGRCALGGQAVKEFKNSEGDNAFKNNL